MMEKTELLFRRPQAAAHIHPSVREEGDPLALQQHPLYAGAEDVRWAESAVLVDHPVAGQALRGTGHQAAHDAAGPGTAAQQGQQAVGGHPTRGDAGYQSIYLAGKVGGYGGSPPGPERQMLRMS